MPHSDGIIYTARTIAIGAAQTPSHDAGVLVSDGKIVSVKPLTAVYIKPGCRHRAIGRLTVINIPVPAFDPEDEWFD